MRLLTLARSKGPIHSNQCGSLPGLSKYSACVTLVNDLKTLQRTCLKVSSLFLDKKAGFDKVDNPTLARILREGGIPSHLVSGVSSFLGERSCTLVFQGAPGIPAPVNVGAPQGSPLSPLLFLIYVAPLDFGIPWGVMLSYVDDIALTVTSLSYRGNIRCLQGLLRTIQARAVQLGISFSVPKTELIHWRSPAKDTLRCASCPFSLTGSSFTPGTRCRG